MGSGHEPNSLPGFAGGLPQQLTTIPKGKEAWIACASGYRSATVVSLLDRGGVPVSVIAKGGVPEGLVCCYPQQVAAEVRRCNITSLMDAITAGFLASLAAGVAAGVEALPSFFLSGASERVMDTMLGFAAEVMIAASAFSVDCACTGTRRTVDHSLWDYQRLHLFRTT